MSLVTRIIDRTILKANSERLPVGNTGSFGSYGASAQPVGQAAQLGAMTSVAWLFATVNRISQSIAAQQWKLYRVDGGDREEIDSHPALDLWRSANPYITREDFLETSQQHMELTGESWWVLVRNGLGVPVEMQVVRPDRMRIIPHPTEFIASYEYRIGGDAIALDREDVIFMRTPNPLDPYRGIGVVQAMMVDLGAERAAAEWMQNFFRNSAEPGGIIEFPTNLQDADFQRLAERWRAQHQGVGNAHRVAILERGTWKDRKLTQRDMQFEQLRRFERDQILGAFGMPLPIMGIVESVNRANALAAELLYARWLIRPRLIRIRSALNQKLLKLYPDGDSLQFDFVDPVPADRVESLNEATSGYEKGILSLNEARRRLNEDLWDGPEGDQLKPMGPSPMPPMMEELAYGDKPKPRRSLKVSPNEDYPDEANSSANMIERGWNKRFRTELDLLIAHLSATEKSITKLTPADVDAYDWDWYAKYGEAVLFELTTAFSTVLESELPLMSPNEVQRRAAVWATLEARSLLLVDGPKNLTVSARRRVSDLVSRTVETGDTLQNLVKELRKDPGFSAQRARAIARTETATALGQGQKEAAVSQGRSEKRWVSQGDALVSQEICGPNEDEGWVAIDYLWQGEFDTIPGHPNCRCTVQYRETPLAADEWPELPERVKPERSVIVPEIRCPQCNRKGGENVAKGTSIRCKRCKHIWEV